LLTPTLEGTALVTLDVRGRLTHSVGASQWTFDLAAPQQSAPAAGLIDGDSYADFAVADGNELRVLLTDARGPTSASWRAPSRATQALLADLVGNGELEIVAERVFDARGAPILELEGWSRPVAPPVLARVDRTANRALLQIEARTDGRFELTRYDVERALRGGNSLVARTVLKTIAHVPSRGGFAVADVTGDRNPDVLLPTEDGLLFIVDGEGNSPFESPLPTLGTVLSSPAVGVAHDQLEFAVRTTRGDLVRWLGRGLVEDITWESAGHDRANTWNAETKLPTRHLTGLGVTNPPIVQPKACGCTSPGGVALLGLVFLFRRRRRTC
jgi:MYXO-CTERM domain-containing protein